MCHAESTFMSSLATMHKLAVLVVVISAASKSFALNLDSCNASLGLESGYIKDAAITASSSYDASNVGPQFARLNKDKNGGAWCPKQQVMRGVKEWIEIDLKAMHAISAIQTQGRFGNGQGQEYVEHFKIEYWRPGMERWVRYRNQTGLEIFAGNTNTYMVTSNDLNPVILATKIRIVPHSIHRRTVCLRLELSGCQFEAGVVSYSAPQGDVFRSVDLIDESYDGIIENGFLKGGLGQLTDGRVGSHGVDDFGYEWVGWQNKTNAPRLSPLELTFEFQGVRNFSRIDVFANNDYHKNIQVFSELRVLFSIGGRQFPSSSCVIYSYMPDRFLADARNVSIHLGFKMARYLKLQFTFAAEWLVISELYFTSEQIDGNFSDDVRVRGRQTDEGFLQRDAVAHIKTSEIEDNVLAESDTHTGIIIGVMTSIIVALALALAIIISRSVHNVRQTVGRSVLSPPFGRTNPQNLGLVAEHNKLETHFGTLNYSNHEPAIYSPIGQLNATDSGRNGSSTENSSTVYNEPFSDDSCSVCSTRKPETMSEPPVRKIVPAQPDYDIPIHSGQTERNTITSPSVNVSFMSRLYTHMNCISNSANEMPPFFSSDMGGFYATADLLQQQSEQSLARCTYKRLAEIPSTTLNRLEHLSSGQFGAEVYLCQLTDDSTTASVVTRHFPSYWTKADVDKECQALGGLRHDKLLPLLGIVSLQHAEDGVSLVFAYGGVGDMYQFLQDHVAETSSLSERSLSYGCLIYMAKQIAAAMEYLEIREIPHRDLAARNCLVEANYGVKIASFGIHSKRYPADYFAMDDGRCVPLRWMAWESVALRKYSSASDVWSFAVLLWEILTFARDPPIEALTDKEVLNLLLHYQQHETGFNEMLLASPILCPKEIYDLMCECWKCNSNDRPTFKEIHMFLMRKNLGYHPSDR
ncbi:discoidin domain-containing receptor tyrosine kinase B isoform X1 [Daphnia magna]|uniref:discoidin domain-containing receptor tyrosine kinase B isoform X1 n=1 Tax=Daphnia magna TaxID=35525 RepID=UPI001E1BDC47|nr:discoidin domain-containing receptor tyrosine kinase B isoform X1 [Daphnia magna]XP_045034751.1 discoidin domain-containing receptor tyrosine kinase B isoform X1 [Daphnia magna]XP_045034752.1 discoidin domain-containing receptor tyrosine kinase B isoform X1 [Daphnia magna]XP_045034753.1 discoidin domain-containing receptor tyrosine kinase B isoform X1 [Daphnia magna]